MNPAEGQDEVFPAVSAERLYEPPADGDLLPRFIDHLGTSSRQGLRYARERLRERGAEAVPALRAAAEAHLQDGAKFGLQQNLLQALIASGDPSIADLFVRYLETSKVVVVRTTAVKGLEILGGPEHAPALIQVVKLETELAPMSRALSALGKIGGEEAAGFLEDMVLQWIGANPLPDSTLPIARIGPHAWNALLLLDDEGAKERLARIGPQLGPFLSLQALATRVDLGERGLTELVRDYLEPARFPSARTRSLAVRVLALEHDWPAILARVEDPEAGVRKTVAEVLRHQQAVSQDVGLETLWQLAEDSDPDVRAVAMQALLERGQRQVLEPYLSSLRNFPVDTGSVEALLLLKDPIFKDPRTVPILISRWPFALPANRFDIIRAMGKLGDPAAVPHLDTVLRDQEEEIELRAMAATQLANMGESAIPVLKAYWQQSTEPSLRFRTLESLARYAGDHEQVAQILIDLISDDQAADLDRQLAMDVLPLVLGEAAFPHLVKAWQSEARSEIRTYLNNLLLDLY